VREDEVWEDVEGRKVEEFDESEVEEGGEVI
jgi:hypothetical protein